MTSIPKIEQAYQQWRNEVYELLIDADFPRAGEFLNCSCFASVKASSDVSLPTGDNARSVFVCSGNPAHDYDVRLFTCHQRICPDCAHRFSARLLARYVPPALDYIAAHNPSFRLRKIELTTPFSLFDPAIEFRYKQMQQAVIQCFDMVLGSGWRKTQGLIVNDEFGEDGYRLHFHIIHAGPFVGKDELTQAWKAVTGGTCEVTWIKGVTSANPERALIEAMKYAVKMWHRDKDGNILRTDPAIVARLATLLHGKRRVRTYGIFYKVPEPEREPQCCEQCGAPMERWKLLEYRIFQETGYLPAEFDRLRRGEPLDLKLGNNFCNDPPNLGDDRESKQKNFLELVPVNTIVSHYE